MCAHVIKIRFGIMPNLAHSHPCVTSRHMFAAHLKPPRVRRLAAQAAPKPHPHNRRSDGVNELIHPGVTSDHGRARFKDRLPGLFVSVKGSENLFLFLTWPLFDY